MPITIVSSPDPGPRLYEGIYNIWVITIDGTYAWQLTKSEAPRSIPTWSSDSQRVAFSEGIDGELVEMEVDTQSRRVITRGAFSPRYRPDGHGIGYITRDGGLAWIDANGTIHIVLSAAKLPRNGFVYDFDWFPNGQYLVYTLADETKRQVDAPNTGVEYSTWIVPINGANPVQIATDLHDVLVSPDGQMIMALQGSGYVDACFVDSQLRFLQISPDYTSAQVINPSSFGGYPQTNQGQFFYPQGNFTWISGHIAHAEFGISCDGDNNENGQYMIDPIQKQIIQ